MRRISYFCIFIISISLLVGKSSINNVEKLESHMDVYSHVKQTQHDNIDNTTKEHVHSHKHSENGKEHEHKHEHSKINQHEMKLLATVESIQTEVNEYESAQVFSDKNLNSNPHLLQIFRPPIS